MRVRKADASQARHELAPVGLTCAGPRARVTELAQMKSGAPVVSVYLTTRWRDARERETARRLLDRELRRAYAGATKTLAADLDWVGGQLAPLFAEPATLRVSSLALFVSGPRRLREAFILEAAVDDAVVTADRPFVAPLAEALTAGPASLVVLVDAQHVLRRLAEDFLGMLGVTSHQDCRR